MADNTVSFPLFSWTLPRSPVYWAARRGEALRLHHLNPSSSTAVFCRIHNVCAEMIPRVCTCKSAQKNRIVRIENGTFLPIWLVAFGAFLWQYITYWMQIADAQSDLFTVAFERSSNKYIPLSELNGSFVENRQAILASIGSIVDRRPFREFGGNSRISRVLRSPFSRLYFFQRVVIVSRIFHMPP